MGALEGAFGPGFVRGCGVQRGTDGDCKFRCVPSNPANGTSVHPPVKVFVLTKDLQR